MKQSSLYDFDSTLSRSRAQRRPRSATWSILVMLVVLGIVAALAQANLLPSFSPDDPLSLLFNGG